MSNFIDCQEQLLATARLQGYLTFDNILDAASSSLLSSAEIDHLSDNLQSMGIMLLETAPVQNFEEAKEISDYSRSDYDRIFAEVISLSEAAAPLIETIKEIPPPQYGEIQTLTEQLQYGNEFARERLILLHLRVAVKTALSLAKQYSYPVDDAISAAFIGLVEAVEHFDPNGFSAFLSYASMWIQQNIHRYCTPIWMEYYFPTHIREKMFPVLLKYNSNQGTYIVNDEFDSYTLQSISDELEIDYDQAKKFLLFAYNQASNRLDSDILRFSNDELSNNLEESHLADDMSLFDIVASRELSRIIPSILETLTPREQEIIRLRYGFCDGPPKTLEEVGQVFDITRERVRQIEIKCIQKLRHPSKAKLIKDFYTTD